jgi:hypothetical protein
MQANSKQSPSLVLLFTFASLAVLLNCAIGQAQDPYQLLKEADRFAFLHNWVKAGPLYSEAEKLFAQVGDERNTLYARVGQIYSQMDRRPFPELFEFLSAQLETPAVQFDQKLKLLCLIAKGEIEIEINTSMAHVVWEQVLNLAKELGDKDWEVRAKGKLTYITFFQGDLARAKQLGTEVFLSTLGSKDVAAQISYWSFAGLAMNEMARYNEGQQFASQALELAQDNPEVGFPFGAYGAPGSGSGRDEQESRGETDA